MRVTVDVKGEETHEIDLEAVSAGSPNDGAGTGGSTPTYQELLGEIDLSPHEVSVLVDGRPVPEDQPVESDHVTVLRLIKGGSEPLIDRNR
ncbi:ubiquitin-like small modifier protein SAMP2 [Natronorubrum sp. DTA28]|uniref:ubiquitin-like small modifier protein SAMP2 n=1 Tax=Natronorubrum sp. DTA28 TaxID=3447019 RepID=UPI003F82D4FC